MSATTTITMQPVTSSQIAAIGHAPELNILAIQFPPKKSTGVSDVYHYQNVDAALFAEFLAAESQGSFFIQRIKKFPELYSYAKLDSPATEKVTDDLARCAETAKAMLTGGRSLTTSDLYDVADNMLEVARAGAVLLSELAKSHDVDVVDLLDAIRELMVERV